VSVFIGNNLVYLIKKLVDRFSIFIYFSSLVWRTFPVDFVLNYLFIAFLISYKDFKTRSNRPRKDAIKERPLKGYQCLDMSEILRRYFIK
jgi:hypothetical protein